MAYGRLTIVGEEGRTRDKHKCVCLCGNVVYVALNALKSGNTKSCGCLRKEMVSARFKKHGMVNTPEYTSWQLMKDRCYNPSNKTFKYYGGAGVKVCKRWRNSFQNFLFDMGMKPSLSHSIDRINGAKIYSVKNCRWASKTEQARNRGNTLKVTFRNELRPLAEWCDILGLPYVKTYKRIWRGWSVERAFKENA